MVVGIVFVCIGLFVAIPMAGAFGVFWTLVAVAITIFSAMNVFSPRGLAHTEIEVENNSRFGDDALPFDERLRRLEKLRSDQLISDEEYQRKRQEIMRQSW
jgi:cytochrome c-type biogenesis protein CcmH/NrfG